MILDELKLIKNMFCLVESNQKVFDKLSEGKEKLESDIKNNRDLIVSKKNEIDNIPQKAEEDRKNLENKINELEEEKNKNIALNNKNANNESKRNANAISNSKAKGIKLEILYIFISGIIFLISFLVFAGLENRAIQITVSIIVCIVALLIFTILNIKHRKDEVEYDTKLKYHYVEPKKEISPINNEINYYRNKITEINISERTISARKELAVLEENNDILSKQLENYPIKELNDFKENTKIAKETLNELLDKSPLYKDYKSFECICQFIQYLESGRCSELEGPHGCYNLYETELRTFIVVNELKVANSTLEQISRQLHELNENFSRSMSYLFAQLDFIVLNTKALMNDVYDVKIDLEKNTSNKSFKEISKNTAIIAACSSYNASNNLPSSIRTRIIQDAFSNYWKC